MDIDKQQRLDTFVQREVIMLASQLVENLLEATAKDYGYHSLEAMQESGEDRQEIYEWWFVSRWLYEHLKEAGEPVLDSDYGYLWGRTCTGQAIAIDTVIEDIFDRTIGQSWKGGENE